MKTLKSKLILVLMAGLLLMSSILVACSKTPAKEEKPAAKEETKVVEVEKDKEKEKASTEENKTEENKTEETKTSDNKIFDDYANKVGELVKENWTSMDKVWPTYNYNNHNFVLFYLNEETGEIEDARLLNSTGVRKLEKKEYDGITPPNPGGYSEIKFEGKPSIAMSTDKSGIEEKDSVNQLYRTATHELVHFYYQGDIKENADSNRFQVYPIEKSPRLVRRMIFARLIEAYENPDKADEYLGKAKFWLDKFNTEFKAEADGLRSTDIAEATARYTENLGTIIGKNLSAEEFARATEKDIPKKVVFVSGDSESYELGYVAALILDKKNPEWKKTFYDTNKNVEEILLENVKPIEDTMDPKIESMVTKEIDEVNAKSKKDLNDIIVSKDDKKVPYLHVDVKDSSGSFTAEGMYRYDKFSIISAYSRKFTVNSKDFSISNLAVIEEYNESERYLRIPLTMPHEVKDGVLTIKSEHLNADGIKVETKDEDGRTIYMTKTDE